MGAFKLGNMTFGSLFKKPETVLYPIERKPQPEGLKGQIAINVNTCILCGLCERSCPTSCITVDKAESSWSIDRFACIQCNYCTTVCPKDSLVMNPDYASASVMRGSERFIVPNQEKQPAKQEPKPQAAPVEQSAIPAHPEEPIDELLDAKIALMDAEKAAKVRAVLGK